MSFRIKLAVGVLFAALIAIFISILIIAFRDADSSFERQYNTLVKPYAFNFAGWEARTLYRQIDQSLTHPETESALASDSVLEYFSYVKLLRGLKADLRSGNSQADLNLAQNQVGQIESQITALRPAVEQTLERQISLTLAEQGIYNPIANNWLKFTLPPVNFVIENPPHILIISPRDRIERIKDSILLQDMSLSQVIELESSLEMLDVSVLVEGLGGLGATYPSFVEADTDLRFTLDTALEEWLHQYLAFKPLGFRYVLDSLNISSNNDIPTLNETAASIMAKELGSLVYAKYYENEPANIAPVPVSPKPDIFDFNKEMREIRKTVDNYLTLGQITQAEKYMNDKRLFLETRGYYIRKLNQAYFAFHGSYADSPTSVDPIGDDIRSLRKNSPSIKDFLETVSYITSREDLGRALNLFK
jgi:hypothetical protein